MVGNDRNKKRFLKIKMKKDLCVSTEYALTTLFQPIVSIKQKQILGFEALTRGIHYNPYTGDISLVPYASLYEQVLKRGNPVTFDRACRQAALQAWKDIPPLSSPPLLFINFDVSVLDRGVGGSGVFMKMVTDAGLEPHRIVIELVERSLNCMDDLVAFVQTYRKQGFLIAIDDFGEGCSSVDRLVKIQPDIIKVSHAIFDVPHISASYRHSLISGLFSWITSIGALPLIEGIEKPDQLFESLDAGIDTMQGFYFSHPRSFKEETHFLELQEKLDHVAIESESYLVNRIKSIYEKSQHRMGLLYDFAAVLEKEASHSCIDAVLHSLVLRDPSIECLYILNSEGIQISQTHLQSPVTYNFSLYQPAQPGDDLSGKDYYLHIRLGAGQYYSDPYISWATGSLCRTLSISLRRGPFKGSILCMDILEDP